MEGERKEERGEGKRGGEIRKGNKIIESTAGRKRRRKRGEREEEGHERQGRKGGDQWGREERGGRQRKITRK